MNNNCLKGMECPKCKSEGPFQIAATALFTINDDGTEDPTGVDWEDDNFCGCKACGYERTVKAFKQAEYVFRSRLIDRYAKKRIEEMDMGSLQQAAEDNTVSWCEDQSLVDLIDEFKRYDKDAYKDFLEANPLP